MLWEKLCKFQRAAAWNGKEVRAVAAVGKRLACFPPLENGKQCRRAVGTRHQLEGEGVTGTYLLDEGNLWVAELGGSGRSLLPIEEMGSYNVMP